MKKPEIKMNWLDRLVNYVNPEAGYKRRISRTAMRMVDGYTGASKTKRALSEYFTTQTDANAVLTYDIQTLRDRSRDLCRNNPLALGAINTKVSNIIGTGLRLQSCVNWRFLGMTETQADEWKETVEREFSLWAESKDSDVERALDFYEQQELAIRSVFESGDAFVLLPHVATPGMPYRTRIQLIEADRVCNEGNQADTETLCMGVEKNSYGAPVAYHVMSSHPGAIPFVDWTWRKIPAFGAKTGRRNILHMYFKRRPGQSRGVPDLAPVIEALKQLGRYTEGELMAAVISGMFTVFVKSEGEGVFAPMDPTGETGGKATDEDYKLGPGAIVGLDPNEDVTTANPGRPNQAFDPFVQSILRQIGVALELPFEILVKHFTSSYSAARAALLDAWKYFLGRRRWMSANFCQPIYEAWLEEAIALGRIEAPGFLGGDPAIRKAYADAYWIGPARGQIDELKEVQAAEIRVRRGFSSLEKECAEMNGTYWDDVHWQRVKEIKMRQDAGMLDDGLVNENSRIIVEAGEI
jgi:lambda family phage portal protein